jgi:hypothetical protein
MVLVELNCQGNISIRVVIAFLVDCIILAKLKVVAFKNFENHDVDDVFVIVGELTVIKATPRPFIIYSCLSLLLENFV